MANSNDRQFIQTCVQMFIYVLGYGMRLIFVSVNGKEGEGVAYESQLLRLEFI